MSYPEVERYLAENDIVLIPVGATEQHGHHAPMMLDTAWAMAAAEGAAKRTRVLVAPPLHYGWSHVHMAFAGTITLRAETFTGVAVDICESLVYHGFRKLVIVNGNRTVLQPLDIAAVKVRNTTGAYVAVADCGLIAKTEIKAACDSGRGALGHAGEAESSMILHTFPQFTDMRQAVDGTRAMASGGAATTGRLVRGHMHLDPGITGDSVYIPTRPDEFRAATRRTRGVRGAAQMATAEKGEKMVKAMVDNLSAFIEDIRRLKVTIRRREIPI
ncbi:MAG: creatininase family protein [Proteobacteria bacterium]|nr:creatininase family protein [Pseudomonadota bacterium]